MRRGLVAWTAFLATATETVQIQRPVLVTLTRAYRAMPKSALRVLAVFRHLSTYWIWKRNYTKQDEED